MTHKYGIRVVISAALLSSSTAVLAQTSVPAEDEQSIDNAPAEIVVTAQKREQRLTDVGISVVAASADQLQAAGVVDPGSLAKISPGFTYARTIHGYSVFSIRGVNFNASQISAAPTVSAYVDEAALPYASMTGGLLLDVDRIEILKGPQGTLFGQNATGGSVNVIAAKPTSELAAGFDVSANHFGRVDLNGFVSGPVSDTVNARLAFSTSQFGTWQKGYAFSKERIGDENRGAARLLVDWQASDRLKISLNVNGNYDHGEKQAHQLAAIAPQNPAGALPALLSYPLPPHNNRAADVNVVPKADDYLVQAVLRADWDIGEDLTLTSITNGIKHRHFLVMDGDATVLDINVNRTLGRAKSFSQELRLTGRVPSQGINYIAGFNYQKDKFFEQQNPDLFNYSSLPPLTLDTSFHERNRAVAVFGNIDWEFVEGLTLTAGARQTWTRQSTDGCTADTGDGTAAAFFQTISDGVRGAQGLPIVPGAFQPGQCTTLDNSPSLPGGLSPFLPTKVVRKQKQKNTSWRAGLNYKPTSDVLVYGLVSRGYKAGVYPFSDTIVASQIRPVKQEELTSYEAGVKADLLDRRVHLEGAVFHYDYADKQFFTFDMTPYVGLASTLINIPKSEADGFELSTVLRPERGLTISGGVTYVDSKIGNYQGLSVSGAPTDFSGKEFNFAPKWSATGDAEYRFPVSDRLETFVGGNFLYNSRTFSDLANSDDSRIPGYTTYDARVGVESDHGWRASLWVRNLTDKFYWTSVGTGADVLVRYTGQPRTFGATFGVKY